MRIGVRARCQRQGIGRKLMEYLLTNYPVHLNLDVSTDNDKAMAFYRRLGLVVDRLYVTEEDQVEFAAFTTPTSFLYTPASDQSRLQVSEAPLTPPELASEENKERVEHNKRVFNEVGQA